MTGAAQSRAAATIQWWILFITGGLAFFGAIGGIADLIQPIAAAVEWILAGSICGGVVVTVLWRRLRDSDPHLVSVAITPVAAAIAIAFAVSASLLVAQKLLPEAAYRGFIGAMSDDARKWQDSALLGIRDDIAGVAAQVAVVQQKFTELQASADPVEVSHNAISAAGYTEDNAGYIRSIAKQKGLNYYYEKLNIQGSEADLKAALLEYEVGSNEFNALKIFLKMANSDHYASRVRQELRNSIVSLRASKSLNGLHEIVCDGKGEAFTDEFWRANLSSTCASDVDWVAGVLRIGQAVAMAVDNDHTEFTWWLSDARAELVLRPSAARQIALQDLIDRGITGDLPPGFYQVDTGIALTSKAPADGATVDLYVAGVVKWRTDYYDRSAADRCSSLPPAPNAFHPAPICNARLVFELYQYSGKLHQLKLVDVQDVQQLNN